ncbi:MAG: response regulator [Xanthomonadales bacterium]|jgi:DNA-binding response OmpR family regulator|nr:response regulator [Xanthomonadales bacterium]
MNPATPRILIVEDSDSLRKLVRLTLDMGRYELHEAETGDAAWASLPRLQPQLVILDVMMPGTLDGFALCRRIKADPALATTRVVLLTARSQQADLATGAGVGADAYLVKPFSPLQLIETVRQQLGA